MIVVLVKIYDLNSELVVCIVICYGFECLVVSLEEVFGCDFVLLVISVGIFYVLMSVCF